MVQKILRLSRFFYGEKKLCLLVLNVGCTTCTCPTHIKLSPHMGLYFLFTWPVGISNPNSRIRIGVILGVFGYCY